MLLNKTICKCGKELLNEKFDNYVPNKDLDFYGGRVNMIATHNCECGRQLKGFFELSEAGDLKLIDLEVIAELKIEENKGDNYIAEEIKTDLNETSCVETVDLNSLSYKELQGYAKSQGIDKVNVSREKLIEKLSL